jgi:hypothetical protein
MTDEEIEFVLTEENDIEPMADINNEELEE